MRNVKDQESPNEPTTEEYLITKKVIEFIAGIKKSNRFKGYSDKQEASIVSESELYDVWLTCLRICTVIVKNSKADSKFQECENTKNENLDANSNTQSTENYSYSENISLDISALPKDFMDDLNEDKIHIVEKSGTNYVSSEFLNYKVIASFHKEIYDENYKVGNDVTIVRQD
ncbi:hypothetical protein JTB14_032877 [Gonioctena quinquepunctata]|nr:hypothetical protein JTB14_032877 [Gonioctena quinquepunctata]